MNEWGFIGKGTFAVFEKTATPSRPQVLNLNQGRAA